MHYCELLQHLVLWKSIWCTYLRISQTLIQFLFWTSSKNEQSSFTLPNRYYCECIGGLLFHTVEVNGNQDFSKYLVLSSLEESCFEHPLKGLFQNVIKPLGNILHLQRKWYQHVISYHKSSADFMINLLWIPHVAELHLSGFDAISVHVCVCVYLKLVFRTLWTPYK